MKRVMVLAVGLFTLMVLGMAQDKPKDDGKTPSLTPAQRETIRKFQLDDQRLDSAIKQRQLEIVQAQLQQQQNAKKFQDYVAGICGDKFQFDMASDELRCIAKPTPTPTPTPAPTPTPEKKK